MAKASPLLGERVVAIRACEQSGETLKAYATRTGVSVFTALPRAQSPADFEALLPWRIDLPEAAHRIAQR